MIILAFLAGVLFASGVTYLLSRNLSMGMDMMTLISYPLMFLFVGVLVLFKSKGNSNKSPLSLPVGRENWPIVLWVVVLTFAAGFLSDLVNSVMPPMPEQLAKALEAATGGNFWINVLCVAVMAPLLEEWLCRGLILRGLKNTGMRPWLAIVLSALFFALIHGNPWQGIPAFMLGCLFGYVYHKTGSLRLPILMHFTNNFISILLSRVEEIGETDTWMDIMPRECYFVLLFMFVLVLVLGIREVSRFHIVDSENVGTMA